MVHTRLSRNHLHVRSQASLHTTAAGSYGALIRDGSAAELGFEGAGRAGGKLDLVFGAGFFGVHF